MKNTEQRGRTQAKDLSSSVSFDVDLRSKIADPSTWLFSHWKQSSVLTAEKQVLSGMSPGYRKDTAANRSRLEWATYTAVMSRSYHSKAKKLPNASHSGDTWPKMPPETVRKTAHLFYKLLKVRGIVVDLMAATYQPLPHSSFPKKLHAFPLPTSC